MTLLGLGLFFSDNAAPPAPNAAPSATTLTLNFDFFINAAPTGSNQSLVFVVTSP